MNLRTKTFLIVTATFMIAFIAMAILLSQFISNGFEREENQSIRDKVLQVQSSLEESMLSLDSIVTDWAEWDDSYEFMQNYTQQFVVSNLSPSTFVNARVNLISYLDTEGNSVFTQMLDFNNYQELPITSEILPFVSNDSPLLVTNETGIGAMGIINLEYAPMIVVSHPILTTDGDGPMRGTLIFGRYLDPGEIGRLSRMTHLTVSGFALTQDNIPSDIEAIITQLQTGSGIVIKAIDEDTINGYALLDDLYGNDTLLLQVSSARPLYAQSRSDVFYFALSLLTFGLLFIMVILMILEKLVISRVGNLSQNVSFIGQKADPSARVTVQGKDEISNLSININGMLEKLELLNIQQKENEAFNFALLENSPNPIVVLNEDRTIRYVNPALEKLTGYNSKQLAGRKPPYPWWLENNMEHHQMMLNDSFVYDVMKKEQQFKNSNGEFFWVESIATSINQGNSGKILLANWVDITERKQSDIILREKEKRFREMAELLPELVFETDLNGKLTFVNRIAFSVFGYSPIEYDSLNIWDLIMPEHRSLAASNFYKLLDNEYVGDYEYTAITKAQTTFPVYVHTSLIKNNFDETIGLRGIMVDISTQKEAEAELRKSEQFSRDLLINAPHPIIVFNPDLSVNFVNPALEKLSGYSGDELLDTKPPYKWWSKIEIARYNSDPSTFSILEVSDQAEEKCFVQKNGEIFWVTHNVNTIHEHGQIKYHICNWTDITERKITEDALRESEEFSSSLRDNSPYPIAVINPDYSLRYVNPALEKLTGYSAHELVGNNPPFIFWPEQFKTQYLQNFKKITVEPDTSEMLLNRKNGDSFWVTITSNPIKENNKVKYILAIWVDITERKLAQQEMENLYQREKNLREALQAEVSNRIEFTRSLVHELKTPLTPIMASSELLVEEIPDGPLRGLAKNVHSGAENMNRRVEELLDMARGEIGMLKVRQHEFHPGELFYEVFEYMKPIAQRNEQSLLIDLPDKLPVILADDDRVRQILLNLIGNAIKYSPDEGTITLSAQEEQNRLIVSVNDTGRGMSSEEQEKLFQPYSRIEGKERLGGLGIGLALSKKLIELQGGQIWVESEKGVGSTFYFSLHIAAKSKSNHNIKTGGRI